MSGRKRRTKVVPLPWERRHPFLSELLSRRQLRPLSLALGAAVLSVLGYRSTAHHEQLRVTRAALDDTQRAVWVFRAQHDRCPRSMQELVHPPSERAQYLTASPRDGWGRELMLRCPGELNPHSADVVSAGPSGLFSVDDNVY